MRFEELKGRVRANPVAAALLKGPQAILDRVRAPAERDLPGSVHRG